MTDMSNSLRDQVAIVTGGARGFSRGTFFTRDGRLVASVAQEGLVRPVTGKGGESS